MGSEEKLEVGMLSRKTSLVIVLTKMMVIRPECLLHSHPQRGPSVSPEKLNFLKEKLR